MSVEILLKNIHKMENIILLIIVEKSSGGGDDNPGGGIGYADAEVNLETYNSFNVGDEFCRN